MLMSCTCTCSVRPPRLGRGAKTACLGQHSSIILRQRGKLSSKLHCNYVNQDTEASQPDKQVSKCQHTCTCTCTKHTPIYQRLYTVLEGLCSPLPISRFPVLKWVASVSWVISPAAPPPPSHWSRQTCGDREGSVINVGVERYSGLAQT